MIWIFPWPGVEEEVGKRGGIKQTLQQAHDFRGQDTRGKKMQKKCVDMTLCHGSPIRLTNSCQQDLQFLLEGINYAPSIN